MLSVMSTALCSVLAALQATEDEIKFRPDPLPLERPVAIVQTPQSPDTDSVEPVVIPIRFLRRWMVQAEVGVYSLASAGPTLTFHATPHLAFDAGFGSASSPLFRTLQGGMRLRLNIVPNALTPFVAIGPVLFHAKFTDVRIHVTTGLNFIANNGFSLTGALGFSPLVYSTEPAEMRIPQYTISGMFTQVGPTLSLAVGYSF